MAIVYTPDSITVSGVGVPINGIQWPSGQFQTGTPGSNLCAFLSSANASFGFNLQPHQFQLEFIPCGNDCEFHGASGQLPNIGSPLELYIGDFLVRGAVSHSDYSSSIQGTVVNVTVEDTRRTLRRIKVHTEDLGEDVPSGVVSIARAYRIVNGLTTNGSSPDDAKIQEYDRILQFGATYNQLLQAIDLSFNEGRITLPVSNLPTSIQLESNIGGSSDAIRFLFNLTPLDEVMTRVLLDSGYDWYWGMDSERISLINKKNAFLLEESEILNLVGQFGSASGLNETTQLGFGQDVVPDPTRFRLLGGHQEGIINSALLSPIDGLDTSKKDGKITFSSAWDKISIGFYDDQGYYRTYIPNDKELQLALAGIEQWAYFKKYQTGSPADPTTPGYGLSSDVGSLIAQNPGFQSRLDPMMPQRGGGTGDSANGIRVISNRRDENNNWALAWYNRVRAHATRHYGRSYVAEGILYNEASGLYRLIDAAWANVENQVQGHTLSPSGSMGGSGLFTEDYEISRNLGPISPFITDDFRVRAHVVLPADTIYGPQGDDSPASFGNWTEDAPPFNPNGDGKHYVPVDLKLVGQRVINPRSDDLYGFEQYPEGTIWCQLPAMAGPADGLQEDAPIANLATLLTTRNKLSSSGTRDIINPAITLEPYGSLTTVAIPIQARSRYGQTYPSQWVLGTNHYERDEDVQLDDQFVPWAFSPVGNQTSLSVMTDRAIRRVQGKIVPQSSTRYADFSQVGLPLLSFDSYANQGIGPSGSYGEISHGVSTINIGFGIQGFSTRYKIQSYYPQFGREAPQGERIRALINGIINPIDFSDLQLLNPSPGIALDPTLPGNELPIPIFFDEERRAVRVTITEVNNVFTLSSSPGEYTVERYRGEDNQLYTKPPSFSSTNADFTDGAICIDGFLNIGDQAIYHSDELELPNGNVIFRYFTQGRSFGNGTVVQVERAGSTNPSAYDVTIIDPTASNLGVTRAIFDLTALNGTINIGDRTSLVVQGDAPVVPGQDASETVFLTGTVSAGAGVVPALIISVSGQGLPTAICVARGLALGPNNELVPSGQIYGSVIPLPVRQFAASGDIGYLAQITVNLDNGATAVQNFIDINKAPLIKFGNI